MAALEQIKDAHYRTSGKTLTGSVHRTSTIRFNVVPV